MFVQKLLAEADTSILTGAGTTLSLRDFAEGAPVSTLIPLDVFDLQNALDSRLSPPESGGVRLVRVQNPMATLDEYEIHAPTDGRPMLVDISHGAGQLHVASGYAVVLIRSGQPVDVVALDGTDVTVVVGRGNASRVSAAGHCSVTVFAEPGSRGILDVRDRDASVELHGDTSRFRIANSFDWDF
ncbi:hypothetical protein [Leifsonia sp. Leaf264]|uniref:hypothetical protein n=1 Tax=Leifsonia sp. Leaf264 TaxID=1736314 RepID=UPI0006FF0C0B|nr:hypothetical protein [Leifsonia sp. Leaf264]KQO98748.1 hypothetical protein ASF30_11850 [Leifsonia sp. Leaf264]